MVKGEAAKASRDETAAVEFISLMVYGFKLDSGATQMNKMIKPNPYFADPMTSITAMLQPFGAANANALITFVNGEVDDAATAQAVD